MPEATQTEQELRTEIARLAPGVEIVAVGCLLGEKETEAVVSDRHGQYRWSHYKSLHGLTSDQGGVLAGQGLLF